MIDEDAYFQRADTVMTANLGNNVLMMDAERGQYFELTETGRTIWDALEAPSSVDQLVGTLCAAYDVDADVARSDVLRLLSEMADTRLVQTVQI